MPTTLAEPGALHDSRATRDLARAADFEAPHRDALLPRAYLSLAEWSERYRWVTQGPLIGEGGEPAKWSNNTFPLQRKVMAAIEDPRWTRVVVMAPPQAGGKTDCAAINTILKALHHDRVDCLYVGATKHKAHDMWEKKFSPAITASAALRKIEFINTEDAGTQNRRDFNNGASLFFCGAESVGSLSGSTIPVVVCDDVQAMPASLGELGHTCDIAFRRSGAVTEEDRTHVMLGTAGTVNDYLWTSLASSTFFRPYLGCPKCGTYQLLDWDRMNFDETDIDACVDCYMSCENESCDYHITDEDLPAMLRGVEWRAYEPDPIEGADKPKHKGTRVAGFWWNAMYWPFQSWSGLCAQWMDSRGSVVKERDFQLNVLVKPFEEPEEDEDALTIGAVAQHRQEGHCKGIVPAGADLITLTADVHDRFLYYIVRAWCVLTGTSWLIDAGTLGVHGPRKGESLTLAEHRARVGHAIRRALDDLWAMEVTGWKLASRPSVCMNAKIALIDAGYRPEAVGQFCLLRNTPARPIWRMILGRSNTQNAGAIWPNQVRVNKRGHPFRPVNVDEAKHMIRELLAIPRDQPGAWHTYSDSSLEAYHAHMVSEHFVSKMKKGQEVKEWEKRPGAGPNHWWDCETYGIAAALACKVKLAVAVPKRANSISNFFGKK